MLRHLSIRDFAIVDALDLDFEPGLSVLSGETGAGKSILIDALGLLLGDRAEGGVVRAGRDRAELAAEFDLSQAPDLQAWLQEHSLDDADAPGHCVLRRVIQADGRNRVFINGSPANVGMLRALGEQLVDIHGQHEHQRLMRGDAQRELLDQYGQHDALLAAVRAAAREYDAVAEAIEQARRAAGRDPAQIEYLRFQLQELEALNLQPGEVAALDADHRRLANMGRLLQDGARVQGLLDGDEEGAHDRLGRAAQSLLGLMEIDPAFAEVERMTNEAQLLVREASDALRRILDRLDLDPARLEEVERRLGVIHDLARKHRVKPEQLVERLDAMTAELAAVEHAAADIERLQQRQAALLARYRDDARALTAARLKAARSLGKKVTEAVRPLGMAQAVFTVQVETRPGEVPRLAGEDEVRFDFSANPGQPARPMAKVASGGELSRLSLAIQVVATQAAGPATMIFDEVDAGIGGGVAEIVGQKLRALAEGRQLLCVTHLPQVAAQGMHHFSVRKEVREGQTYTRVVALDASSRTEELARMLGGLEITAQTRAHAEEMLSRARKNAA